MQFRQTLGLACLASLLPCLAAPAWAADLPDKGREIFKKHQAAVVTVQIVLKSKLSMAGMGGRSSESKQEVTGTVIDPSGLTVLSLSATDPSAMLQGLLGGDDDSRIRMETELSDVKILMDDGSELPAEIVLRDRDQDLAFLRPKTKPGTPMAAVDLTQAGEAQVLDQVVTLNRLGEAAGRSYSASVERISAIVRKPRLFYVPDSTATATSMGSPAFTQDGKVLGIMVMRAAKGRGGGGLMAAIQGGAVAGIVLPSSQVLKAAKQAPEVKAEAKDETKDEKK